MLEEIMAEIEKVITGKREQIEKVIIAMLAQGHILIEDIPGVGKTTLVLALGKVFGMEYHRIQFTPDVMPTDVTGYHSYSRKKEQWEYHEGVVMCNLLLADEINRTSPKTQSALLEVMEEGNVTVDGTTYEVPRPFCVIATQNPYGMVGTQPLPQSQLDRFMIKVQLGYPDFESQVQILQKRQTENPLQSVRQMVSREEFLKMQEEVRGIAVRREILHYITRLTEETRRAQEIHLGVSPRGALALNDMAKALAWMRGRDYVIPEDIASVFVDVCSHRITMEHFSGEKRDVQAVLKRILQETPCID